MRVVGRPERLRDDHAHVEQVADEHQAERAQLDAADGVVAEIEAIGAHNAEEDAEQSGRLIVIGAHVAAEDALVEADRAAVEASTVADHVARRIAGDGDRVVACAVDGRLLGVVYDRLVALVLADVQAGTWTRLPLLLLLLWRVGRARRRKHNNR